MPLRRILPLLVIGLLVFSAGGVRAQASPPADGGAGAALPGTGFTYQGQLNNGGTPVNGACGFEFRLFDAVSGGTQLGSAQAVGPVTVADGRFTVTLNEGGQFGARAFDGSARWLAISVRCPDSGGYTALTPRQPLTPAPLAFALPGLRTEQNATSPNVIGGYISNTVTGGAVGAVIAGGGASGQVNTVSGNYSVISGGWTNLASGEFSTVAGGAGNTAGGSYSAIGGGIGNTTSTGFSTVAGGYYNVASGQGAFVGGGETNFATGDEAVVGGGVGNSASGVGAVVGGGGWNGDDGAGNTAAGVVSTIGGGYGNTIPITGSYAVVAGGSFNDANGAYSFAAGRNARALHEGAFVWSGSETTIISSTVTNQFLVRASGGVSLTTNSAGTIGASLPAGSGSWGTFSDRNAKANFAPVDGVAILNTLMGIPVESWNYTTQDTAIRHLGPMAQDFYAAFGLGEGETTISVVDADGVALAAIQGLYTVVLERDAEIAALRDTTSAQQTELAEVTARLAALESIAALEVGETARWAVSTTPSTGVALPWLLLAGLGLLNLGGLAGYALARARRPAPR